MRLTAYLMHWKNKRPHGILMRGKHRRVNDPKFIDLLHLRHDFEREERNMLILRHPYLTIEQSHGHMDDLKVPIRWGIVASAPKDIKFTKHFKWQEQLAHLRVTEAWE